MKSPSANIELSIAKLILFVRRSFAANKRFRLANEIIMIGKYLPTLIIISNKYINPSNFVESEIAVMHCIEFRPIFSISG
jgi:hypothetical protein